MTAASPIIPTIIRRKELEARTGLSRTAIYDRLNTKNPRHDPTFPTQISLGGDSVGWVESEVSDWIASRIAASRCDDITNRPTSRRNAHGRKAMHNNASSNVAGECRK